jgi:hypothetical protein
MPPESTPFTGRMAFESTLHAATKRRKRMSPEAFDTPP